MHKRGGKVRNNLLEKPEDRRPLRRPRHRCEDNIKINLKCSKNLWAEFN
jgi:hypothetical protein